MTEDCFGLAVRNDVLFEILSVYISMVFAFGQVRHVGTFSQEPFEGSSGFVGESSAAVDDVTELEDIMKLGCFRVHLSLQTLHFRLGFTGAVDDV